MNAAAAEPLVVGGDDGVAIPDESLDRRDAIIGPRIAADEKILIERLRGVYELRGTAVFGRASRAMRPRDDRAPSFGASPVGAMTNAVAIIFRSSVSDET